VHAFANPEATELGKKFNLPLRYDAKVDQEAKAEAAKFLPLTFKNRQKRPPTWWAFLSVAESSHHDQIQTGNRRGLHGCSDLKLLDFGFASKSRQTSLAGPLRTSLLCVYARSWPNANFFLVVTKRWRGACKSFPMVSQAQKRYATTSHKCLISLARSERFELPTLGFEV
jgi:hypothetical protein